jgi:DNA-binding transcriptional regulator YiaG
LWRIIAVDFYGAKPDAWRMQPVLLAGVAAQRGAVAEHGAWHVTGAEIKAIRRGAGLTQRVFAEAIGMQPNSLARIERGERSVTPRVMAAVRLLETVYRLRA